MFLRNSTISLWNYCRYGTAPFAFASYSTFRTQPPFPDLPCVLSWSPAGMVLTWWPGADPEPLPELQWHECCGPGHPLPSALPLLVDTWENGTAGEGLEVQHSFWHLAHISLPNTNRISGVLLLGHVMVKTNSGYLHFLVLSWCISDVETEAGIMHLLGEKSTWHQSNIRISAFALPSSHYSRPLFPSTIRT